MSTATLGSNSDSSLELHTHNPSPIDQSHIQDYGITVGTEKRKEPVSLNEILGFLQAPNKKSISVNLDPKSEVAERRYAPDIRRKEYDIRRLQGKPISPTDNRKILVEEILGRGDIANGDQRRALWKAKGEGWREDFKMALQEKKADMREQLYRARERMDRGKNSYFTIRNKTNAILIKDFLKKFYEQNDGAYRDKLKISIKTGDPELDIKIQKEILKGLPVVTEAEQRASFKNVTKSRFKKPLPKLSRRRARIENFIKDPVAAVSDRESPLVLQIKNSRELKRILDSINEVPNFIELRKKIYDNLRILDIARAKDAADMAERKAPIHTLLYRETTPPEIRESYYTDPDVLREALSEEQVREEEKPKSIIERAKESSIGKRVLALFRRR